MKNSIESHEKQPGNRGFFGETSGIEQTIIAIEDNFLLISLEKARFWEVVMTVLCGLGTGIPVYINISNILTFYILYIVYVFSKPPSSTINTTRAIRKNSRFLLGLFSPHIRGFLKHILHNIVIFENSLAKMSKRRKNADISGTNGTYALSFEVTNYRFWLRNLQIWLNPVLPLVSQGESTLSEKCRLRNLPIWLRPVF